MDNKKPKAPITQALLGTLGLQEFIDGYYGKQWLYLNAEKRGREDYPLSMRDIDTFFENDRLRHPWVKLVSKGAELPIKEFNMQMAHMPEVIDNKKLFDQFEQGHTIIANSIDKTFAPISRICRAIEEELKLKVWANLYISPAGSRGFGLHEDIHDVIVLQLSGTKNWKVYPNEDNYTGPRVPGPDDIPEGEFCMKAGEFLYLPKKQPHLAYAGDDEPSVHLTLGLEGWFWIDVVKGLLKAAKNDKDFEQRVPIPLQGEEVFETFQRNFKEKYNQLLEENDSDAIVNRLLERESLQLAFTSSLSLSSRLMADSIDGATRLRKVPGLLVEILDKGAVFILKFADTTLKFPVFVRELVQEFCSEKPFTIDSIQGSYETTAKVQMARKLLKAGMLECVD